MNTVSTLFKLLGRADDIKEIAGPLIDLADSSEDLYARISQQIRDPELQADWNRWWGSLQEVAEKIKEMRTDDDDSIQVSVDRPGEGSPGAPIPPER